MPANGRRALKFVVLIGVLSFFADFTYEGSRSIVGPYLATLQAGPVAIATVSGLGELLGYALRLVSGRAADRSGKFWPITIFGYFIQMLSVPALALAGNWQTAAALIVAERVGKAIRNPPRDVMLSHAGKRIGHGWAFGLHEALDQLGALFGPLLVALLLARRGDYRLAYASTLGPALICLTFVLIARLLYPKPEDMEAEPPNVAPHNLTGAFWMYLTAAGLVAAGFVDYPLMAYHLQQTSTISKEFVPVFYAVAMGVSGMGSLVLGRLYDRWGFVVLIALTIAAALFAPLVFWGGFWEALTGVALWGLGMGVHESIIPAAVAPLAPRRRRASAYGLVTAGYGLCWFLGSIVIGLLYKTSLAATVAFCLAAQVAAIPVLVAVLRSIRRAPILP
ncbi:MAG TPA: MFS transporter [Bryobacteraceae bacterium]|nr:MFS transporter [Bryobacteraceae bacterium]